MMAERNRLPARRPSVSCEFLFGDPGKEGRYRLTTSVDPSDDVVREIFLAGGKIGSGLDGLLGDVAVLASLALQSGIPLNAIRAAMARAGDFETDPATAPRASALGVALDLAAEIQSGGNGTSKPEET